MIKKTGERVIFKTKFFIIKDIELENDRGQLTEARMISALYLARRFLNSKIGP